MKKILLMVCLVFFTCTNAQAVQQMVFHNMNNSPYRYGYRNPYNYGYNAPYNYIRRVPARRRYGYTPRYPALTRYARRYYEPYRYGYYNPYYNPYYSPYARKRYRVNTVNVSRREPLSRFDRNYVIPNNYNKKVYCGGVTYYGGMNPCR